LATVSSPVKAIIATGIANAIADHVGAVPRSVPFERFSAEKRIGRPRTIRSSSPTSVTAAIAIARR